jgi:hypothetical protein
MSLDKWTPHGCLQSDLYSKIGNLNSCITYGDADGSIGPHQAIYIKALALLRVIPSLPVEVYGTASEDTGEGEANESEYCDSHGSQNVSSYQSARPYEDA